MERKFSKTEKWGLRLLFLFIAGWIALFVYVTIVRDDQVTLRQNDLRRILNCRIYETNGNLGLPEYVDKVKFEQVDSVSSDGFIHYRFRFLVKSKEKGKSWHRGTVAEKDLVFKDITYTLAE